jgi:peptide/nickel transport system substrate-binding protein
VPYPIGDPSADLETVDIPEKIDELATATDSETEQSLIEELSWIYNQHLPRLPLMNGVRRVFLNRDGWSFPERDSKYMMQNPTTELWSHGQIRAEE